MRSYELIQHISFSCRGKNLTPEKCNPLLRQFRRQLESYELREGELFARPAVVDEFQGELVDSTWVLASQQIKWDISDSKEGWASRANNFIRQRLSKDMMGMKLDNGEKYTKRITITVEQAVFQGEPKVGRWVKEKFSVISF